MCLATISASWQLIHCHQVCRKFTLISRFMSLNRFSICKHRFMIMMTFTDDAFALQKLKTYLRPLKSSYIPSCWIVMLNANQRKRPLSSIGVKKSAYIWAPDFMLYGTDLREIVSQIPFCRPLGEFLTGKIHSEELWRIAYTRLGICKLIAAKILFPESINLSILSQVLSALERLGITASS